MSNKPQKNNYKDQGTTPLTVSEPVKIRSVESHRQCPLCWGTMHGEGKKYSNHHKGAMTRFYLRCDMCGHTWTADIVAEVVAVDHRLPEDISAR